MSTINICMTSYPRRINNCVKVIKSILENTVLPDRIYLTLSSKEFPQYEQSIPNDLYHLIMTSDRVVLNWVDTNWKSMKKVFPVLPYLEDDDIIIDIDDDMALPKDFIESRMKDFEANNREHPITSNLLKSVNLDNLIMSCYSLFQKRMLLDYERFVDETVLNTFNDDRTYLYLCHLNGFKLKPCTKYCTCKSVDGVQRLELAPHADYQYAIGPRYDAIVRNKIHDLSGGKDINDCFGLFKSMRVEPTKQDIKAITDAKQLSLVCRSGLVEDLSNPKLSPSIAKLFEYNPTKPTKHDLVYVLGRGSKWNNMEIKISITSMLKFCSHWIGEIYVVGENPRIRNPRVKHIYAPDITRTNKDANIINKILTAINKIPKLT